MASRSPKLRPKKAAARLGLSPSTLAKMRVRGDGPVYIRMTARAIAYDEDDLDAWADARRRRSTSDSGEAV